MQRTLLPFNVMWSCRQLAHVLGLCKSALASHSAFALHSSRAAVLLSVLSSCMHATLRGQRQFSSPTPRSMLVMKEFSAERHEEKLDHFDGSIQFQFQIILVVPRTKT
jgi:hypothetical protein